MSQTVKEETITHIVLDLLSSTCITYKCTFLHNDKAK